MLISCYVQVFAWEIADQLLIKKQSTTSCFIGAQTMRTKVSWTQIFHNLVVTELNRHCRGIGLILVGGLTSL